MSHRTPHLTRLGDGPIVGPDTPGYDTATLGTNINGPSAIRVPDWVADPLGRYYLYFAHHQGESIRLAYADDVAGPYRVHTPGTLQLDQTPFRHHIASPDLHIDQARQRFVMYYHGCGYTGGHDTVGTEQQTCVATSPDGLHWSSETVVLGESYFRVFDVAEARYAVSKGGRLYRQGPAGDAAAWETRRPAMVDLSGRHWAVWSDDNGTDHAALHWVYSRWGDAPERLLHAITPLRDATAGPIDWARWRLERRADLLAAEHDWEGAHQPIAVSLPGSVHEPVHELRDPAYLRDSDGREYLFYSVAGEAGIAVAELKSALP